MYFILEQEGPIKEKLWSNAGPISTKTESRSRQAKGTATEPQLSVTNIITMVLSLEFSTTIFILVFTIYYFHFFPCCSVFAPKILRLKLNHFDAFFSLRPGLFIKENKLPKINSPKINWSFLSIILVTTYTSHIVNFHTEKKQRLKISLICKKYSLHHHWIQTQQIQHFFVPFWIDSFYCTAIWKHLVDVQYWPGNVI